MADSSFAGLLAEYYDRLFSISDEEYAFYRELLKVHPGTVLEVGSGTGQLLLRLLGDGFDVQGVEISPEMVDVCMHKAAKQGLYPTVHTGSVLDHAFDRQYAVIILPSAVFQLITLYDDPTAVIQKLCALLQPGGLIVMDLFTHPTTQANKVIKVIHQGDESVEVVTSSLHDRQQTFFERMFTFTTRKPGVKDVVESCSQRWRLYTVEDVRQLLGEVGVNRVSIQSGYDARSLVKKCSVDESASALIVLD